MLQDILYWIYSFGIDYWHLVAFAIGVVVYRLATVNKNYWKLAGVQNSRPRLTAMWSLFFNPVVIVDKDAFDKYGPVFGSLFGTKPLLMIADPECVKEITVKQFSNFAEHKTTVSIGDDSTSDNILLNINHLKWKGMRNVISASFSGAKLKAVFPALNTCAKTLVRNVTLTDSETPTITLISHYLLDALSVSLFGDAIDSQADMIVARQREQDDPSYKNLSFSAHATSIIESPSIFAMLTSSVPWIHKFLHTIGVSAQRYAGGEHLEICKAAIRKLIEKRIEKNAHNPQKHVDLLAVLLEAQSTNFESLNANKRELNMDEIVANLIIFFVGGYDTTSTALEWTLFSIANNQHAQDRLYQEICENIKEEENITYKTVDELEYLNSVINETLRMYPPTTSIDRVCTKNTVVRGMRLTKNDWIIFSVYALHYNEHYWKNPNEFCPERFMPENISSIVPFSFLPWGAGPRNCVGQRLAYLIMKIAIVHIVRQFKVTVNIDKTLLPIKFAKGFGMIKAEGGLHLNFEKR